MKKIVLIGTDEGSFDYNRNVDFQAIKDKELQLQLHAEFVCSEIRDTVMMMVFTRYLLNKDQLINYSISLNFKVDQWVDYIRDKKDEDLLHSEELHRMLAISVGFLRGSLSLQLRTTPLKGAFLPLIDIDALCKNVNINRVKEETVNK